MIAILDFDGVIVDSAYECLITSNAAYEADRSGVDPLAIPTPTSDFTRRFLEKRYLVRFAGEYWLLLRCLKTGVKPLNETSFQAAGVGKQNDMARFEKLFFAARRRLVSYNQDAWLDLHRVYPEFSSGWDALCAQAEDVYVLSMKDKGSILHLLAHFGIDISEDRVLGREAGFYKKDVITALTVEQGREFCDFVLLDDHVPQLVDIANLGACCCWAAWGYWIDPGKNMPPGIRVCKKLEDILSVRCR